MFEYSMIFLQIIAALVSTYLLYYSREKAKNQASKEDLNTLTKIVEDIKHDNSKDLEKLKSNLSLLTGRHLQIFSEEKDAFIKFYAQLSKWFWENLNVKLNSFNYSNFIEIDSKLLIMQANYNETNIAFSKVELLVTDNAIVISGHEAIIAVLNLHHFIEGLAGRLKRNLQSQKINLTSIISDDGVMRNVSKDMQDYFLQRAKESEKEQKDILAEFDQGYKGSYTPAIEKINTFKEKAKQYLKS